MLTTLLLLGTLFHPATDSVRRFAVIDSAKDSVRNVVLWDSVANWTPGAGYFVRQVPDSVHVGEAYKPSTHTFK